VTTLFTVPAATLAAALIGAGVWLARPRPAHGAVLLLALSAAASIGPFVLGTTPIFGAEKHWMPVLPTICLAAAVGAVWAARAVAAAISAVPARIAIAVVAGCVVLASVVETQVAEPYALTWYNTLAGGAPGAADLGMNRQFWGVAMRGVLPVLVEQGAPATPGARTYVYTHDAAPAWGMYQRLGLVPPTLLDAGWEQTGIDRSQQRSHHHRRALERLVADRVGNRVQHGAAACGHRRFADAARADRRFGIRNPHRFPRHLGRNIQDGGGPVVVETFGECDSVVLSVDPLLAQRMAEA